MEKTLEWAIGLLGILTMGLSTVVWYMLKDHHQRIQRCENSNISRKDVNELVVDIEDKFQRDHHQILDTVNLMKTELRDDIKSLREDIRLIYERRSQER